MKQQRKKDEVTGKDIGRALKHTACVSLAFIPSSVLLFLLFGDLWIVVLVNAIALFIVTLIVAGFLAEKSIPSLLFTSVKLSELLYGTTMLRWSRMTLPTAVWGVAAGMGSAIADGAVWLAVLAPLIVVANWWLVQGSLFIGLRQRKVQRQTAADLQQELADALKNYFAPAFDYRVTPTDGATYIDEDARLSKTVSHITAVEELEPNVYRVDFRNNVAGKTDANLIKELEVVSSLLGLYDWEPTDGDPRNGFVSIKVWKSERTDATSAVSGMLMWIEGEEK